MPASLADRDMADSSAPPASGLAADEVSVSKAKR